MITTYSKKNIYNRNNINKDFRNKDIFNQNLRAKFSNNEFLNFLNRKEFSNKYIFSKAKNKIKTKKVSNNNIYKMNARKINLSLPKNIYSNNRIFFIKKNTMTQLHNIKNEYKSQNSATNIINDIKERYLSGNQLLISKENDLYIENKAQKEKDKSDICIKEVYKLWDGLYIPMSYRELFNVILRRLNEEEKNKLIENEFNDLKELIDDINDLSISIKMRKETLQELKDMNNKLKLIFNTESEESNSILVKHMSNKIEKMREFTINICIYMKKIKNKIYEGKNIGKYDIDIISNEFKFDKNYLLKMKEEMTFLKEGYAKYFFNISEDRTPFLVKASEEDPNANGDPFIHLVPMSQEMQNQISKCNFIIYQELIAYQNKDFKDNKFRPISPLRIYDNTNLILNSINFNRNNSNSLLNPIKTKKQYEINQFPKINENIKRKLIKENSCINLQTKNINNEKRNILFKKDGKNKNNFIPNLQDKNLNNKNKLIICNDINATLGGKNLDNNIDYIKNDTNLLTSIKKNKKSLSSSFLDYSQKDFEIIYYTKNINKFYEQYYIDYYKRLPVEEINMFQLNNDLLSSIIKGISPCMLILKENSIEISDEKKNLEIKIAKNLIYGICAFYYILSKNKISIKISHISAISDFNSSNNVNNLKKIFGLLINLILEELYFDELIIEYNKKQANQELLDLFINYLNFNVEMVNKISNIEITSDINNIVRTQENGGETLPNCDFEKNVLIFRNSQKSNEKINKILSSYTNKNIINIFDALIMTDSKSLNSEYENLLKQKQNDLFNNTFINVELVDYILNVNNKKNIDLVFNKISSLEEIMRMFVHNNISIEEIPLSAAENAYKIMSCIINTNINSKFANSHFFSSYNFYNSNSFLDKNTGIYYNFIRPHRIYAMYSEKLGTNFYHIINSNIALFFVQINEEKKKLYFRNNNNIYIQIEEIYNDLLNKQPKEIIGKLNNKIIWIPCFNIYRHFKYLTKNNNYTVHEYSKICNNIISSNKKDQLDILFKNKNSSFQIEPDFKNDIIIDSDFIFGYINNANIFKKVLEQKNSYKESHSEENYNMDYDTDKINNNSNINKEDVPYVIFLNYVKESDFKKVK